jgi:predicted ATP-grasp superfamily ATP-dependent carboligase
VRHVFVYEYLCATGVGRGTSLETEGRAMLTAILADFARVPGVRPVTLLSGRPGDLPPGVSVRDASPADEASLFRELARASDDTLVIAPEFDGLLGQRCCWVEDAGGRLLGPSSDAVALAGDKLNLAVRLAAAGVPTPPCVPLPGGTVPFPAVCKPRHGAGSQATFLVRTPEELAACPSRARADGWEGELLLQPFVPGSPASVAFLLGPRQEIALAPALQQLSTDGRFRYLGGTVPLAPPLAGRAVRLAGQAVRAVPGLRGYVGVDLVLGEPEDGSADRVIEINPRLTTSYVGLRALATTNLAETLLRVADGEPAPAISWRAGSVGFQPDGQVIFSR